MMSLTEEQLEAQVGVRPRLLYIFITFNKNFAGWFQCHPLL